MSSELSKKQNGRLGNRLLAYRNRHQLSVADLAKEVGVKPITVIRWENGSSSPSLEHAKKLEGLGFGKISRSQTKHRTTPRSKHVNGDSVPIPKRLRVPLAIGRDSVSFRPASYVINGPPSELAFHDELVRLQERDRPVVDLATHVRRLSLVESAGEPPRMTAQSELEAPSRKRSHWNSNYGPHGWHRYVGRFPPHVVRSLLNHFGAVPGQTVLDPFVGSGTTLVEARLLGLTSIGIEICPLSTLISRAKAAFPSSPKLIEETSGALTDFYQDRWYAAHRRRSIRYESILGREGNLIPAFPNLRRWLTPEALLGCSIVVEFAKKQRGYRRDLVCCALSAKMRSIGNVDVDVVRAEYRKTPREDVDVLKHVQTALARFARDVVATNQSHEDLVGSARSATVIHDSVLDADLPDDSVDHVITSPPYGVESLSYLRTHLLSYRCLQPILRVDPYEFNEKIVGSEYVKDAKEYDPITKARSPTFASFFDGLGDLPRKLEPRRRMMMAFFDQLMLVSERLAGWMRSGGRLAFVVGNKKLGESVVPTTDIVTELFRKVGFGLDRKITHKLKTNNSNSEVPWQERAIQEESILIFTLSG